MCDCGLHPEGDPWGWNYIEWQHHEDANHWPRTAANGWFG